MGFCILGTSPLRTRSRVGTRLHVSKRRPTSQKPTDDITKSILAGFMHAVPSMGSKPDALILSRYSWREHPPPKEGGVFEQPPDTSDTLRCAIGCMIFASFLRPPGPALICFRCLSLSSAFALSFFPFRSAFRV